MNPNEFIILDQPGAIEKLQAKGFKYIIPGEEYTQDELGWYGYPDLVFLEATPIDHEPEDPTPYRELSKEGICDVVYCYIVHDKYFK